MNLYTYINFIVIIITWGSTVESVYYNMLLSIIKPSI